jgi:hypothetical protein
VAVLGSQRINGTHEETRDCRAHKAGGLATSVGVGLDLALSCRTVRAHHRPLHRHRLARELAWFAASHHHGSLNEIPGGFKVLDAYQQSLAYVYSRETKDAADIAGVLTEDEARRIASNIAKLLDGSMRSTSHHARRFTPANDAAGAASRLPGPEAMLAPHP